MVVMRIGSANLSMTSTHHLRKLSTREERLTVQVGPRLSGESVGAGTPPPVRFVPPLNGNIAPEARKAPKVARAPKSSGPPEVSSAEDPFAGVQPGDRIRILLLERVLGVKIQILRAGPSEAGQDRSEAATDEREAAADQQPPQLAWQVIHEVREVYQESEQLSFTARGMINTADGKQIEFTLQVNLSRFYRTESSYMARFGNMPTDPLVINYAGNAADLEHGGGFQFDLDLDGKTDLMPLLKRGSGFLALDRNGDGAIGDGSELFGPVTGDGFAELSQFDLDQNNWIDANDPIYKSLRIWTRDDAGNDRLFALGELGVGAIYLGGIPAPFSLKDEANRTSAQSRQISVYAKADGSGVGTVQQLDVILR